MKIALAREHRKTLETVIAQARVAAESGAAKALQALAIGAKEAPAHFTKDQIKLRVRLRAHGRQLEVRRRVKEQQKRIGAAEFRNTHFGYTIGAEGVEKFVSTPELQGQSGIGDEPLEAGHYGWLVWCIKLNRW